MTGSERFRRLICQFQVVYHFCLWYEKTAGTEVWGSAVGLLELTAIFAVGFGAGYGIREVISRRRRKAAQSTFIYPE